MNKLLVILFSIISVNVFSQGNTCGTATAITLDGACLGPYALSDATANNPLPSCGANNTREGWFTFTIGATTNITITAINTNLNLAIQLIQGGCGSPTELDCENSFGAGASTEVLNYTGLPAGTYFIKLVHVGANNSNINITSICLTTTVVGGGGSTCASPFVIPSVPFTATGRTTCGFGDDYDDADACGSFYMTGDDFVYQYTPSSNQSVDITLSNTNTWVGLFVLDGCPDVGATNCVASDEQVGGNPSVGCVTLNAGQTYYIIISTFPSPQCTAFDISITTSTSTAPSCNLNYSLSNIASSSTAGGGWTVLSFPDDEFAPTYTNIGFSFCFDNVFYTQTLVSSNGYIIFPGCYSVVPNGDGIPTGYSPYEITTSIPNTTEAPRNSIMLTWQDIDPSAGGNIRHKTTGTTPNQIFILQFNNVRMFDCETDNTLNFTGEIRLYETSNIIEFSVTNKQLCPAWNNGAAFQGLLNYTGTISVEVPGHDYPTNWTETNAGYRFTPNCTCTNPLAADLLSFNGVQISENENKLTWSTASENNMEKFILEKSENGSDFFSFKEIQSMGNSNSINEYSDFDHLPYDHITYYRLKQLDYNGEFKYSNIIAVNNSHWNGFTVLNLFPNPSDGIVNAEIYSSDAIDFDLEIKDISGRTLNSSKYSLIDGTNFVNFDLSSFDSGIYFMSFINLSNGQINTLRIIKE